MNAPAAAMDPRTRLLLEGPIARTLLKLAAPNVLVMFVQASVGLIETYFVGKLGTDALDLSIKVNLGIVHPVFAGDLALSNVVPAHSYTLSGRGRGGMLGLAQGDAHIRLEDAPDGTLLSFVAAGKADGGIMRLGKSLIGKSAQRVIDGFFESIGREMGANVTALPST